MLRFEQQQQQQQQSPIWFRLALSAVSTMWYETKWDALEGTAAETADLQCFTFCDKRLNLDDTKLYADTNCFMICRVI